MSRSSSSPLSALNVIVGVLVGTTICILLIPTVIPPRGSGARLLKDGVQQRQVHEAWVIFARETNGRYPTPGAINRLGPLNDESAPEDRRKDVIRHVHSLCIMRNYYNPELVISLLEPNRSITTDDDYNYEAYDPAADLYWDGDAPSDADPDPAHGFDAALGHATRECNVSYAMQAMIGARHERQWTETFDPAHVVLGTRGPFNGATRGAAHDDSPTLMFHGDMDLWSGNLCFNDNHIAYHETFFLDADGDESPSGDRGADNIFLNETVAPGVDRVDIFLAFQRAIIVDEKGAVRGGVFWNELEGK